MRFITVSAADKARFHSKYTSGDPADCWLWAGALTEPEHYGVFWLDGGNVRAHRLAYMLHYGSLPNDMLVCHSCDVPQCVNPHHLFLGTERDNSRDMVSKGRRPDQVGAANHAAVLTDELVRTIRAAYNEGETQTSIAKRLRVSQPNVSMVVNKQTWAHLDPEWTPRSPSTRNQWSRRKERISA